MRRSSVRLLDEGFIAGLIGYATVALSVGLLDVLRGRSFFYTASLLGEGLFGGLGPGGEVAVTPDAVFSYNGLHLIAFLVLGLVAAWLVRQTERHPHFWYAAFFIFLGASFMMFVIFLTMTIPMGAGGEWWSFLVGNSLAALAVGAYLSRTHPGLAGELRAGHGDPEKPDEGT